MVDRDAQFAFLVSNTPAGEDGLYTLRVDPDSGGLSPVAAVEGGESPSFLAVHPDGQHLYVVNEVDEGAVRAYAVDRESGTLTALNRQPSGGAGPCHCSVDASGEFLLVANYRGGTVAALPIADDGRLGDPADVVERSGSGPDPDRQEAPHPHSVTPGPGDRFALVADLGTDEVAVYELDRDGGGLDPAGEVAVHDGAGPRHLDFHPDGETAYLANELDSTLTTFAYDPAAGGLSAVETVDTLREPVEGRNYPADVHVHPDGERVYLSNRGHDSVAVFDLDADGRPTLADLTHAGGEFPRNFALDPAGQHLYAENQHTDDVVVFDVDEDGRLEPTGSVFEVTAPMCMRFLPPA